MKKGAILAAVFLPMAGATASAPNNFPAMTSPMNMDLLLMKRMADVNQKAKIRTLRSALPPLKGKTFIVQALDPKKGWAWDFTGLSAQVAEALSERGMTAASPGRTPDYIVWIDYAAARTDLFDKFFVFVVTDLSIKDLGQRHIASGTAKSREDHIFYEAVAAAREPRAALADVLPGLVATFFERFPDQSGRSQLLDLVGKAP